MSPSRNKGDILSYMYLRLKDETVLDEAFLYIQTNNNIRLFVAAKELTEHNEQFSRMYRMTTVTYEELIRIISPQIIKRMQCSSAEERITHIFNVR